MLDMPQYSFPLKLFFYLTENILNIAIGKQIIDKFYMSNKKGYFDIQFIKIGIWLKKLTRTYNFNHLRGFKMKNTTLKCFFSVHLSLKHHFATCL